MGCGCSNCSRTVTPKGEKGNTGGFSGQEQIALLSDPNSYALDREDSGVLTYLDKLDGIDIALPPAEVGLTYPFEVVKGVTSNSYKITTASPTDVYTGYMYKFKQDAYPVLYEPNGSSNDTITLNGTTTGGLAGTSFRVTCYETGKWYVQGQTYGTGDPSTPFSD